MRKRLRLIVVAFSVSFAVFIVLCLLLFSRFGTIADFTSRAQMSQTAIGELYDLEGIVKDFDRAERGYLLTKDTLYSNGFERKYRAMQEAVVRLQNLYKNDKAGKKQLVLLKSSLAMRVFHLRNSLAHADTTRTITPDTSYFEGRRYMLESLGSIRQLRTREEARLQSRNLSRKAYQTSTFDYIKMLAAILIATTVCLFLLMIRALRDRLIYQNELQEKLIALKRSHAELEQIAFAASHDLQEPLRKIRVLSNRLEILRTDSLSDDIRDTIARISQSASRMHHLIEDMVDLTSLTRENDTTKALDLNNIIHGVLKELDETIVKNNTTVRVNKLSTIAGYHRQIHILFKSLLDNASKFSASKEEPVVTISGEYVNGEELIDIDRKLAEKRYYRVAVNDNGIGFDNRFTERMFMIFQRLHTREAYDGKGIGLAMCQRIMTNHDGYIIAHGHLGTGAIFKLFFPIPDDNRQLPLHK